MVVAIQKGLGRLEKRLREMGHEVVIYGEYRFPIDVLVYVGGYDSALINVAGKGEESGQRGVLLINAEGKTAEEIDEMIRRRLYTPLF